MNRGYQRVKAVYDDFSDNEERRCYDCLSPLLLEVQRLVAENE